MDNITFMKKRIKICFQFVFYPNNRLKLKFSNLSVLNKVLLMQVWLFRLGWTVNVYGVEWSIYIGKNFNIYGKSNRILLLYSERRHCITLQICTWEIPRKVVLFEIFLHWFKCTNYTLYDIENISKNTTGITIYPLYLG